MRPSVVTFHYPASSSSWMRFSLESGGRIPVRRAVPAPVAGVITGFSRIIGTGAGEDALTTRFAVGSVAVVAGFAPVCG